MENKKTKLTISGGLKKSFKDINDQKDQGKKTVIINRQSIKSAGKSNYAKVSGYKTSSNNFKKVSNFKTNFKVNNSNLGITHLPTIHINITHNPLQKIFSDQD